MRTTHIGSLPFSCIDKCILFNEQLDLPALSTLPGIDKNEFMLEQVAQGICGAKIENFKIILPQDFKLATFKFPFLCEKEFINHFQGQDIKWQIVGPVTLMKATENLPPKRVQEFLTWHFANIISYHKFLLQNFKRVYFFLDEPSYSSQEDVIVLTHFIERLRDEVDLLGVHCCGTIDPKNFRKLNIDYLSFDYELINSVVMNQLMQMPFHLVLGVVNTVTLSVSEGYVCDPQNLISPACGLAYTEESLATKVPKLLKGRTDCS